jgi:hypothetical protein
MVQPQTVVHRVQINDPTGGERTEMKSLFGLPREVDSQTSCREQLTVSDLSEGRLGVGCFPDQRFLVFASSSRDASRATPGEMRAFH